MALTDNLIAGYALDEASGNAVDVLSTNDLTLTGTVGTTTGKVSGARSISNNGYFRKASGITALGTLPLTLVAWFKTSNVTTNQNLFGGSPNSALNNNAWGLYVQSSKLGFYASDGSGSFNFLTGATTLSTSTWYFAACVWRSATDREIYLNAASDGTSSTSRSPTSSERLAIGTYAPTDNSRWLGDLDECYVWGRSLSGAELTSLYNGGSGLAYPWSGGGGFAFNPSLIRKRKSQSILLRM